VEQESFESPSPKLLNVCGFNKELRLSGPDLQQMAMMNIQNIGVLCRLQFSYGWKRTEVKVRIINAMNSEGRCISKRYVVGEGCFAKFDGNRVGWGSESGLVEGADE